MAQDVVVGQDRVVGALTSALRTGRLAHGLLFIGPPGIGRETTARALARGLLCERRGAAAGDDASPFGCGACRACRRVDAGNHPDVVLVLTEAEAVARGLAEPDPGKVRPSTEIKIDAIRDLVRVLPQRPYEGRSRIVIVVDAHRMNEKAQNALLKGLEEPGDAENVLILLVPGERAVLPTIASRCLRLRFAPLRPEHVRTILHRRGVADADARAARPGVWSVADALAPMDDAADAAQRVITGILLRQRGESLAERLDLAESIGRDRLEVDAALAAASRRLADGLRARVAAGHHGPDPSGLDEVSALEGILAARRDLAGNGAVQLVLERLFLGAPPSVLEPR